MEGVIFNRVGTRVGNFGLFCPQRVGFSDPLALLHSNTSQVPPPPVLSQSGVVLINLG